MLGHRQVAETLARDCAVPVIRETNCPLVFVYLLEFICVFETVCYLLVFDRWFSFTFPTRGKKEKQGYVVVRYMLRTMTCFNYTV